MEKSALFIAAKLFMTLPALAQNQPPSQPPEIGRDAIPEKIDPNPIDAPKPPAASEPSVPQRPDLQPPGAAQSEGGGARTNEELRPESKRNETEGAPAR